MPLPAPPRVRHRARRPRVPSFVAVLVLLLPALGQVAPGAAPAHAEGRPTPRWSWPVPDPHPVLRPFVAPAHAWSPGHRGIDVGTAADTVVVAPDDGVVHFSGVVVDRPVLSLRHADGVLSSFEPVDGDLPAGTVVERGQPVGTVRAGHCPDRDCVHVGARVDGDYVSPLLFLGGVRPSVLLPTRR